jgi:DNA-binding transcriptional regulator YiaG
MLTGSDIKTVRERLDLTQKEFGILVGVRFGSERKLVGRWEREDEYPSWEMLRHKLAEDLLEDIFRSSGAVPFRKNT